MLKNIAIQMVLISVGLIYSVSCRFEPTRTNYTEVRIDSSFVGIDLNNLSPSDTIWVWGETEFIYSVYLPQNTLKQVSFYVDQQKVYESTSDTSRFLLDPRDYELKGGYHQFKIEVVAKSNTGSLADRLEMEAMTANHEWILYYLNTPPDPVHITTIQPMEGRLQISWERSTERRFRSYRVYKSTPGFSDQFTSICMTEIFDPEVTEYIDSGYVGGHADYRVDLTTNNVGTVKGDSLPFYSPPPAIRSTSSETNPMAITIEWDPTLFNQNFGAYILSRGPEFYLPKFIAKITSPDCTTYTDSEFPVSPRLQYKLKVLSQDTVRSLPSEETRVSVPVMEALPAFSRIIYNPIAAVYYIVSTIYDEPYGSGNYVRSIGKTFETTYAMLEYETPSIAFSSSQNGQYVYSALNYTIEKIDPIYMNSLESYPTPSLIGWQGIPKKLSVSDNNRLAFSTGDTASVSDSYSDSIYVFDMSNIKLIGKIGGDKFLAPMVLDATGNYLANRSTMYKVTQDSIIKVGPINRGYFWTNNAETFWIEQTSTGFAIKRCADLTILDTIVTGEFVIFGISVDSYTNRLAYRTGAQSEVYHIFDLESGVEIQRIIFGLFTEYPLVLLNSNIFYGEGWYCSFLSW